MQRLSQPAIRWVLLVIGMATLSCGVLVLLLGPLTPSSQMAEAESRWAARPFTHYRLVIEAGSTCQLAVEVRDEQVSSVLQESSCGYPARTVKDLFDVLKRNKPIRQDCSYYRCACRQAIDVYAAYYREWGYPSRIAVGLQREANLLNGDYWRFVLTNRRFPSCSRTSDAEIVRVLSLTPLP
jgi:hypothetical protein